MTEAGVMHEARYVYFTFEYFTDSVNFIIWEVL